MTNRHENFCTVIETYRNEVTDKNVHLAVSDQKSERDASVQDAFI